MASKAGILAAGTPPRSLYEAATLARAGGFPALSVF
jgi:hypothetical protein